MPKIRIYCCNNRYFLAVGEEYLNDILYGTLTDYSDMEIIETDDYSRVLAEWEGFSPDSTPWMIHPNIGAELRERLYGKLEEIEPADAKPALPRRTTARYKVGRGNLPAPRG